ncbi:MAG: hypothetical protein JSV50_17610 [Desulfobacteraceae bacterium]|jgi:hypothetical protein|nr:MAG: hypothetical protein JSV50_17610 [Desulfobacteraceae bacterium]
MAEAYKRLWAAVLEQAIKDVQGDERAHRGKVRSIFSEGAWAWFRSESQEVGSFLWTCNMLGFEPDFILSLLTRQDTGTAESKFMAFG